jgi:protein DJ-1
VSLLDSLVMFRSRLKYASCSTIAYDTLVRAGVSVTSVFVPTASSSQSTAGVATCSRGIRITPDASLEPSNLGPDKHDILVVPGGAKGAETMSSNSVVQQLVKRYYEQGKLVGMICAGERVVKCGDEWYHL